MDFDAELVFICDLCMHVAQLRKRRAMRNKGRKLTARARAQWFSRQLKADLIAITLEAFQASKLNGKPTPAVLKKRMVRYLYIELQRLQRPAGRPKKSVGMIDTVLAEAGANKAQGRLRIVAEEEKEAWVRKVFGKKLALYAENAFHVGHKKTIVDTVKQLRAEPDPADALDSISDAKAIQAIESKDHSPTSVGHVNPARLRALRTRFSREKKRHQALLLQRKSGGYFKDAW